MKKPTMMIVQQRRANELLVNIMSEWLLNSKLKRTEAACFLSKNEIGEYNWENGYERSGNCVKCNTNLNKEFMLVSNGDSAS